MSFQLILRKSIESNHITPSDFSTLFSLLLSSQLTPTQSATFLTTLHLTHWEGQPSILASAASTLLSLSPLIPLHSTLNLIDIVGTGGDGQDTFNVSTTASIIAAACGCTVAKHGNRASSSKCGSADILFSFGCCIDSVVVENVQPIIDECGFCFLYAPVFHSVLVGLKELRREIGIPTIFNLIGPLVNPVKPSRMVVGVHSEYLGSVFIDTLRLMGVERAVVVWGEVGLDEVSPVGNTRMWELCDGIVSERVVCVEDFGVVGCGLDEVKSGTADENAQLLGELLRGEYCGGLLDYVLMNASVVLYVAGVVDNFRDGVVRAREAIESGAALNVLEKFKRMIK